MSLIQRAQGVHGLMESPVFTARILERINAFLSFGEERGYDILDLLTTGMVPADVLEKMFVVRIQKNETIVTHVSTARTTDGACRLFLGAWRIFVNADPHLPQLEEGVHLWLGASWRSIPHAHTASH